MTMGEAEGLGERGGNTAKNNCNEKRKDSKEEGWIHMIQYLIER